MEVYVPLVEFALGGNSTEDAAFYTGTANAGLVSDACGIVLSWTFFYLSTVGFYHVVSRLAAAYARTYHPDRETNKVSPPPTPSLFFYCCFWNLPLG